MSAQYVAVMALEDLAVRASKAIDIDGTSILICRTNSGIFAVENQCTHQQSALEGGIIKGPFLFCPRHAARFD